MRKSWVVRKQPNECVKEGMVHVHNTYMHIIKLT